MYALECTLLTQDIDELLRARLRQRRNRLSQGGGNAASRPIASGRRRREGLAGKGGGHPISRAARSRPDGPRAPRFEDLRRLIEAIAVTLAREDHQPPSHQAATESTTSGV